METTNISILNILKDTTVDGPGFRTSIYAAGCPHHCKGCHNPQSWNIANGTAYSVDFILQEIKKSEFANVTFSGGDPFMQVAAFTELARRIKQETNKTIWCYTGYLYEDIICSEALSPLLQYLDVLVDGRYEESLRDESILFAGSRNQRIIDVPESIKKSEAVLWERDKKFILPFLLKEVS